MNPVATDVIALGFWIASGGPAMLDMARKPGPSWQRAVLAAGGLTLLPLMWLTVTAIGRAPR